MSLDPHPTPAALRAMARRKGVAVTRDGTQEPANGARVARSPIEAMIDATATCARCSLVRRECQCPSLAAFVIVLPLPPNMANGRMHWRAKDRKRKAYLRECDTWASLPDVPSPPRTPHAFAELRAVLTLWNPMDDDGAMARIKWALDWLVTRGYLAGDSRKHVKWLGVPDQQVNRKAHGTVVFRVQPVVRAPRAPAPPAAGRASPTVTG